MKIQDIEVTEKAIGRMVIYTGNRGWGGREADEYGFITSYNDVTVFVCYNTSGQGKGTSPDDLEWNT